MSWLWIIIIVIFVLVVLGYFGRDASVTPSRAKGSLSRHGE